MRTKKISRKLCLNKETISNVNTMEIAVNSMEIAGCCFGCAGSHGVSNCK